MEGFVHDRGDGDAVVTVANHQNTSKLVLRDLLLGKGILALLGTAENDNTIDTLFRHRGVGNRQFREWEYCL